MNVAPYNLMSSVSMVAGVVSSTMDLQSLWAISLQAVWSGAPEGDLKLQASNDIVFQRPSQDTPNYPVFNWTTIASTTASTTGVNNYIWNVAEPAYRWMRLTYTGSSGNGIMTVNVLAKGI